MKGYCEKDGLRIGFGEVSGKVLPAVQFGFNTDESEVEQREAV